MKKNKKIQEPTPVLISWCLDRSGSMGGLETSTVSGFNEFLADQQNQPGKAYLSLLLFDDHLDVRYVAQDVKEVANMIFGGHGENPYFVGGSTALYDAVRVSIKGTEQWLVNHPEFDGEVIQIVFTDGGENASLNKDIEGLNALIREKQEAGWAFQFLGSGGAAWTEGKNFATIQGTNTMNVQYNASTANALYASVSSSINHTRATGASYNMANADKTLLASALIGSTDEEKKKFA